MKKVVTEIDQVAKSVGNVVIHTEKVLEPVRDSLLKRFPILSILLVTFGVSATFFGMERIITDIAWLNERPLVIFFSGLLALIVSGKLYQKLG